MLVLGAADDGMVTNAEVRATARAYRTEAEFFPGMGHNMMQEPAWPASPNESTRGCRPASSVRPRPRLAGRAFQHRQQVMLDRRSGARARLTGRLGGGASLRQRDAEHVVDHRPSRGDLRPIDIHPGALQRTGEQCEQTGAVVRPDLDDQPARRALEPQDPRRRGRVMDRDRGRRLADRLGLRVGRPLLQRAQHVSLPTQRANELLAQQARCGWTAEMW